MREAPVTYTFKYAEIPVSPDSRERLIKCPRGYDDTFSCSDCTHVQMRVAPDELRCLEAKISDFTIHQLGNQTIDDEGDCWKDVVVVFRDDVIALIKWPEALANLSNLYEVKRDDPAAFNYFGSYFYHNVEMDYFLLEKQ